MLVNPKSAATSAIIRKIKAQRSILSPPQKQSHYSVTARVFLSEQPKCGAKSDQLRVIEKEFISSKQTISDNVADALVIISIRFIRLSAH